MGYMDITLTGVAFSDYLVTDVGAGTWHLEHDWFTRQDLVIRTAAGGGGTLLVEGTDYTLSQESTELSTRVSEAVGAGRNVFHLIAIINVAYQTGNLYVSGKYIADSNSAEDVEYCKVKAVNNVDYTVRDEDGYGTIAVNPSSVDRIVTLPTVADNANRQLTIINTGTGTYKVIVDGEGTEKINDVETWWLLAGQSITIKSNGTKWIKIAGHVPMLRVEDQKAAGTDGGTFTAGAWQTRVLNTVMVNQIAGASLASNQITLPAGTYEVVADAPGFGCERHRLKLYNVTDAADILYGTSSYSGSAIHADSRSAIAGVFILAAQKVLEVQHRCTTTRATDGLGKMANVGIVEIYAGATIRKMM